MSFSSVKNSNVTRRKKFNFLADNELTKKRHGRWDEDTSSWPLGYSAGEVRATVAANAKRGGK